MCRSRHLASCRPVPRPCTHSQSSRRVSTSFQGPRRAGERMRANTAKRRKGADTERKKKVRGTAGARCMHAPDACAKMCVQGRPGGAPA